MGTSAAHGAAASLLALIGAAAAAARPDGSRPGRPRTRGGGPPASPHPAGAAASTGPSADVSRRNALGLSPRSRLNAALKPNASA